MPVWDGVADDRFPLVSWCPERLRFTLRGDVSFSPSIHVANVAALAASGDGDSSMRVAGAGAGTGLSTAGEDDLESLPPLERARRRKSMLPSR